MLTHSLLFTYNWTCTPQDPPRMARLWNSIILPWCHRAFASMGHHFNWHTRAPELREGLKHRSMQKCWATLAVRFALPQGPGSQMQRCSQFPHDEVTSNFTQRVDLPAKKSKNRANLRAKWCKMDVHKHFPTSAFSWFFSAVPPLVLLLLLVADLSSSPGVRNDGRWWKRWRAVDFVKCYPGACQSLGMQRRDS